MAADRVITRAEPPRAALSITGTAGFDPLPAVNDTAPEQHTSDVDSHHKQTAQWLGRLIFAVTAADDTESPATFVVSSKIQEQNVAVP